MCNCTVHMHGLYTRIHKISQLIRESHGLVVKYIYIYIYIKLKSKLSENQIIF